MIATHDELDRFHRFANERIDQVGELTLEDCLRLWRDQEETVAEIREADAQFDAGDYLTIDEADTKLREELGFSKPKVVE